MVRPLRNWSTTQRGPRSSPHCSTPAPSAATNATPTPRTTRVTRTACGNGARPCHLPPVPELALHTPLRCLGDLTARPHGASEHALHWPRRQAAGERDRRQRRAQPVAPQRSRLRQCCCLAQAYSRG
eukprot:4849378-Pleurochrysis_carterae.AAC.1